MSIKCGNKKFAEHLHETVEQVKICYGLVTSIPVTVPVPNEFHSGPTDRQLKYVEFLKGDPVHAAKLSVRECSDYIKQLKTGGRSVTPEPTPPPPPPVVPIASSWQPRVPRLPDLRLSLLQGLLSSVPDGMFAVQPEEGAHTTFMRISHPKNGRLAGCLKIQTLHSETLTDALIQWPSKSWSVFKPLVIDALMLLVVDWKSAAILFGRELGRCCRCGKALTDDRSRHYSIGPVCDKIWTSIIDTVDAQNDGKSYEDLHSSSYY